LLFEIMVLGPKIRLWLPTINLTIALSALAFQTTMLYPWHHELDRQFKILRDEHRDMLKQYHELKMKRIEELERRVLVTEKVVQGGGSGGNGVTSQRDGKV